MKGFLTKLPYFFGMFAYLVGVVGGLGFALTSRAYVIAAAVAVLAYMALPKFREYIEKLMS